VKMNFLAAAAAFCLSFGLAHGAAASTISAVGKVTALEDISQMGTLSGSENFNSGTSGQLVPLTVNPGLKFHTGLLSGVLSGVTTLGTGSQLMYGSTPVFFPSPIAGGGTQDGLYAFFGGVMTFTTPTTQFGLTASNNGIQYISAWDLFGSMIGQVKWTPNSSSSFVGIDTKGVQIGMLTYGNDDLWSGESYSVGGNSIIADNYVWSAGGLTAVPVPVPVPASLPLLALGLGSLGFLARRRRKAA